MRTPSLSPPPLRAGLARLAGLLGALAGVGAAFGYVAAVDPNEPGHYPPCPVLAHTGLACPGCGGLRSAHALAHGDVAAALSANALVAAGCALLGAALLGLAWHAAGGRVPAVRPGAAVGWAAGAAVVAFTVLRNLPGGAALGP